MEVQNKLRKIPKSPIARHHTMRHWRLSQRQWWKFKSSGCHTVSSGEEFPTFRKNFSDFTFRTKQSKYMYTTNARNMELIRQPKYISWTHPHKRILTYLLTPWSRVGLEKLTGFQSVKKFPAFLGTRRFITAFTSARQLSLSWASSMQSISPHPTSWRSKSHTPFSLLSSYQSISPGQRLSVWAFRNRNRCYGEELIAPRPTPQLEDHPVSAVRDLLLNIFEATLHIGSNFSLT
jgi:hypothetical protein